MTLAHGTDTLSDRTLNRMLRITAGVLVVMVIGFGAFYYLTQHVSAGPSLIDRQVHSAEAAVRQAPNNLDARLQLATVYTADKRYSDAMDQYDAILTASKGNRSALLGKGQVLIAENKLADAVAAYTTITKQNATGEFAAADPELQEAYYYLGVIAVKQHKPTDALTALDHALKIEPTDSDALYQVGLARLETNNPKPAIQSFKQALMYVPTGWCDPYVQLQSAYTKLGSTDEAAYAGAMNDYCKTRSASAKTALEKLATGSAGVDAMTGLAVIAQAEGNNDQAISWYKKVLAVDKTNINAMSSLAELGVGPAPGSTKSSSK